jgi:hypothetical protein
MSVRNNSAAETLRTKKTICKAMDVPVAQDERKEKKKKKKKKAIPLLALTKKKPSGVIGL